MMHASPTISLRHLCAGNVKNISPAKREMEQKKCRLKDTFGFGLRCFFGMGGRCFFFAGVGRGSIITGEWVGVMTFVEMFRHSCRKMNRLLLQESLYL